MLNKIKIDDLVNPTLTEFQQVAKDYGETLKLELTSEAIINEAYKNSRLQDFGEKW